MGLYDKAIAQKEQFTARLRRSENDKQMFEQKCDNLKHEIVKLQKQQY